MEPQKSYAQLGLGPHLIEQPFVSFSYGNRGYQPDAVWPQARVLIEDKDTPSHQQMSLARKEITLYMAEMWRARKPGCDLDWLGVATDLRDVWWTRIFEAGRPISGWEETEPGLLHVRAPGPTDQPIPSGMELPWASPNVHYNEDGDLVKMCNDCAEAQPLENFYNDKLSCDGFRSVCKPCYLVRAKRYRDRAAEVT